MKEYYGVVPLALSIICIFISPFLTFAYLNFQDPSFEVKYFVKFAIYVFFIFLFFYFFIFLFILNRGSEIKFRVFYTLNVVWFLLFLYDGFDNITSHVFGYELRSKSIFMVYLVVLTGVAGGVSWFSKKAPWQTALAVFGIMTALVPATQALLSIPSKAAATKILPASSLLPHDGGATIKRNVYFVVVDAYASQDVVENILMADISDFVTTMKSKSFHFAEKAMAPYSMTMLTMAAIANADYVVDENSGPVGHWSRFYPRIMAGVEPPALVQAFKSIGYRFLVAGNQWAQCRGPHVKCINSPFRLSYQTRAFLSTTPISWIEKKCGSRFIGARTSTRRRRNRPRAVTF